MGFILQPITFIYVAIGMDQTTFPISFLYKYKIILPVLFYQ